MTNDDITIKLTKNLTINTVQNIRDSLSSRVKNAKNHTILLDLADIELCDTSGLALLIDLKSQCFNNSTQLKLVNIPDKISELANFYEVDELLNKVL